MPAQPHRKNLLLMVASSHGRAKNGFLGTRVGVYVARLFEPEKALPQIGVSLQIWLADDGCKCIAAAHNHFPKYDLYLDGVRLTWECEPSFEKFDPYDIPVEWRAFFAFRLYETLRPFDLVERYPGACLIGWYRRVDPGGSVEWCDEAPDPFIVRFPVPPSPTHVEVWWDNLERLIARLNMMLDKSEVQSLERTAHPWTNRSGTSGVDS